MVQLTVWKHLPFLTAAAAIHIASVLLWFLLEYLSIASFSPQYNWRHNAISDLGIPYIFEDDKHGNRISLSARAALMNTNFRVIAVSYAVAQFAMLHSFTCELNITRNESWRSVCRARHALSLLFMVGLLTVGTVHAGPREEASGIIGVHFAGAGLAIFGGNVNSILAGTLSHPVPTMKAKYYQIASLVLGSLGLLAGALTKLASTYGYSGISERLAVYCILLWGLVTAVWILRKEIRAEDGKGGKDI